MRLSGIGYNYLQKKQNPFVRDNRTEKLILCIGESTTAWGLSESYPTQLQIKLNQLYGDNKFLVVNEGVAATNTSVILESIKLKIDKYKPDYLITMMGINDVWAISETLSIFEEIKILKLFRLLFINIENYYKTRSKITKEITNTPPSRSPIAIHKPNTEKFHHLIQLATSAEQQKNFSSAEMYYSRAEKENVFSAQYNYNMANIKLELGKKTEAKKYFSKYTNLENTAEANNSVGKLYIIKYGITDTEARTLAEKSLKKSLELDPNYIESLRYLGMIYFQNKADHPKAQIYLERAYILLGSRTPDVVGFLADVYLVAGRKEDAETVLKSGLYEPGDVFFIWSRLINLYNDSEKFKEAEEFLELAFKKFPNNPRLYDIKKQVWARQNKKYNMFDEKKVYSVKNYLAYPATQKNYIAAAEIIQNYGIRHIAMQYPRRNVNELKELLKSFPKTVFIENKATFENALKNKNYTDLFTDTFGEDFGHATLLGNQLIADQIIKTLQKENILPKN